MKQIQIPFLKGYVTIIIQGDLPERFFQLCIDHGVAIWQVKKIARGQCQANLSINDLSTVKHLVQMTDYELSIVKKKGVPILLRQFINQKEFVLASIFSLLLIISLANIVWKIDISGVSTDVEAKIQQQLQSYGIHPGSLIYQLDEPAVIQQQLLHDVPELLWIGIERKGTRFFFEGVEKTIVKKREVPGPRHLVAAKKGVIEKMYVSKGLPMVQVNDYVVPGQVLVSGMMIEEVETENDDDTESPNLHIVAAEGDIKAKTWYEVDVTVPLEEAYESLTGNREYQYYLGVHRFLIPIWGFKKSEFAYRHIEQEDHPLAIFRWKLPIRLIKSTISEKTFHTRERTVEEAIQAGIEQARHELQLQLGVEAEILAEKVLHETLGNGKVNLQLYITVLEDIAKAEPIT